MDKADWALLISGISALGSLASAAFAGRMARNDSKRLARKQPAFEISHESRNKEFPNWDYHLLTIRNLEEVGITVKGVRARRKNGMVNSQADSHESEFNGFGEPNYKDELPEKQSCNLHVRVDPKGTPRSQHGIRTGDTAFVWLYTRNIKSAADLLVSWEWSDGQK